MLQLKKNVLSTFKSSRLTGEFKIVYLMFRRECSRIFSVELCFAFCVQVFILFYKVPVSVQCTFLDEAFVSKR